MPGPKVQIYHVQDFKEQRITKSIFRELEKLVNIEVFEIAMEDIWALKNKKVHLLLFDMLSPRKLVYEALEPIQEANKHLYTALVYPDLTQKRKTLVYEKHIDYIFEAQYDDKYIIAKLKNILRRMSPEYILETDYTFKDVKVDRLLGEIFINNIIVETTRKEFKIIKELVKHAQHFLTKKELFTLVWGYQDDTSRLLDQYLQRAKKILNNSQVSIISDRKKGLMLI